MSEKETLWASWNLALAKRSPPRELAAAYKEFLEHGPQHQDAETDFSASAYRFGERVLLVYEEPEESVVVLTHPSS